MRYVTKRNLPRRPTPCRRTDCVYAGEGDDEHPTIAANECSNPYINSGNGDAKCYRKRARRIRDDFLILPSR